MEVSIRDVMGWRSGRRGRSKLCRGGHFGRGGAHPGRGGVHLGRQGRHTGRGVMRTFGPEMGQIGGRQFGGQVISPAGLATTGAAEPLTEVSGEHLRIRVVFSRSEGAGRLCL